MTTKAAEMAYEAAHVAKWEGHPLAVFNPHGKPLYELPVIFGFNNGGSHGFMSAMSISEDGKVLGGHCCTSEAYMPHDLGMIEGSRPDRHENSYQKHYPDGYRCEFVGAGDRSSNDRFNDAVAALARRSDEEETVTA